MTAPRLSPAQIRARLVLSARWIVADHVPARDGRCRVCRVPDCPPRQAALAYLNLVGAAPTPSHRTSSPAGPATPSG